ncbi:MAG: fliH [Chlamydiales bacterium]|jgi:flagellar biosynthesis/type III secretory pathway protein FliH|nr:fliH [Chlamydiales bacterium]
MTLLSKGIKKIIRGADVEGITFCTPTGELEQEQQKQRQEQEHLKTLEEFWLDKGFQQGIERGFEEGWSKGEEEGYLRGLTEGKKIGEEESKEKYIEEGRVQGYDKTIQELEELFSLFKNLNHKLERERFELTDKLRPDLINLATSICEKVLKRDLAQESSMVQLIDSLLLQHQRLIKEAPLTIVLPSEEATTIRNWLEKQHYDSNSQLMDKVQFQPDERMIKGNCRIEFPMGIIHFDIERQLAEIKEKTLAAEDLE